MIQYLSHNEIDLARWDACVEQAPGGLPYGYSWWLNAVCPGWAALVMEDYSAVMPLPVGRKFGYPYIYQPYFTQQLGIFSGERADPIMTAAFLEAIPPEFRYVRLHLNFANLLPIGIREFTSRKNYQLLLAADPLVLAGNYRRNCRRNIQKAVHEGLTVGPGPGATVFSHFIRQHLDHQLGRVPAHIYPTLAHLITAAQDHGISEINGVYDIRRELVAAGWFVITRERCLFMVCASTPQGRNASAMYLLVDDMIRKQARSVSLFDFTGSNLPGVAYFDSGFGAGETFYPSWVRNTLPWPLRLLKK